MSRKKGKQMSNKEKGPREKSKEFLEYWIQLGEPLARMVQRSGMAFYFYSLKS